MTIPTISLTAVGDYLGQRRIPQEDAGFPAVSSYIQKGQVRLCNLETTLATEDRWANQFSGGSFLRADASLLEDVKAYGFNGVSFANNHAFDYGYGGFFDTWDAVRNAGFVTAGVGNNLAEASAPGYMEVPGGRVAIFSISVSFAGTDNAAFAGPQSPRVTGRPGINILHMSKTLHLSAEDYAAIQRISQISGINAERDIAVQEGYLPSDTGDSTRLEDLLCKKAEATHFEVLPDVRDVERMKKEIYNAQAMADLIVVLVHSHQLCGKSKETPGALLESFAHTCIDAGAHTVIASGPHLLRPIELYQGAPIFYSLGDFVLHNENADYVPEEMFQKYGMTSQDTLRDLYARRSANYTRGLMSDSRMHESVIPYMEFKEGKLQKLELLPIECGFEEPRYRRGNPRVCKDKGILERLSQMSKPYGTNITIDADGLGHIES